MAFVPKIQNYRPFYIQASSDSSAVDTRLFGMVAKTNPYPILPNAKTPYNNDFKDENGDDEYVAEMFYEPVEFSVSFYVKTFDSFAQTAAAVMNEQISLFFKSVRNGYFMTYDAFTGVGFRNVRYVSYNMEEYKARANWARCIFSVTFKANDPVTRVMLDNGALVALVGGDFNNDFDKSFNT